MRIFARVRLTAAHLPAPLAQRVRSQFAGKVFENDELQTAIDDSRALLSDLTAPSVINGSPRLSGMYTGGDRLQLAVDDLFGLPREDGKANQKVEQLSGIRELYLLTTGDHDMHGGFFPDRVHLADTTDFTGLVKNAMNKVVANQSAELGRAGYDWWKKIVKIEHCTTLNDITGILVGTVGALPAVLEGAAYTALDVGDSPEVGTWGKYGGYIPLTLELIDRDETRKLREYPRQLANAGIRNTSSLVAAIFTANAGVGPVMTDGFNLFDAVNHVNLLAAALSAAAWEAAKVAVYNQTMFVDGVIVGPKQAIDPKYLLVPRALQLAAMKILYPTLENAANIYSENMSQGAPGDVITVPEWTDVTDWEPSQILASPPPSSWESGLACSLKFISPVLNFPPPSSPTTNTG